MPRPLLAMPEQLSYVHHVCLSIVEALKLTPALSGRSADPAHHSRHARGGSLGPRTAWTARHRALESGRSTGQLDAVCDFTAASRQEIAAFHGAEPLRRRRHPCLAFLAEELVMRDVVAPPWRRTIPGSPSSCSREPARPLRPGCCIDHAKGAIGRDLVQPLLDVRSEIRPRRARRANEPLLSALSSRQRHGLTIVHADPRELSVEERGGASMAICADRSVAYRDYESRDLVALERELGQPSRADCTPAVPSEPHDLLDRRRFRPQELLRHRAADRSRDRRASCSAWRNARLFRRHVPSGPGSVGDRRTSLPHGDAKAICSTMPAHHPRAAEC